MTNAPLHPATHWPPSLLRTERRERRPGETVEFRFVADPFADRRSWRWSVDGSLELDRKAPSD